MIYKCILLNVFFFGMLALTGCHKKGCTDPSAINYNVTADEDDGSCIICKTVVMPLDSTTLYVIDTYSNSIHYQDAVAKITLRQNILAPSDNHCDKPVCEIYLTIESLLDNKMYLSYRVEREEGPLYIYSAEQVLIEGHQIMDMGIIQSINNPPFLELSLDSISATMNDEAFYY